MAVRAGVPGASARRSTLARKCLTAQSDAAHTAGFRADLPTTGRVSKARLSLTLVYSAILAAATTTAALTSRAEDWAPLSLLGLLFVLAASSELLGFRVRGLELSGAFLSIVLAMALLGPAPATALAIGCALVDTAVARRSLESSIYNVATYATFAARRRPRDPLAGRRLRPSDRGPAVVRRRRALHVPRGQHAELPDGRGRRVRAMAPRPATSAARSSPRCRRSSRPAC